MKLKRIAVVIRGHRRTWEYTKKHFFNFFDQVADQVDYYAAIWASNASLGNVANMRDDFKNKNLKYFEWFHDSVIYDAYLSPSYLSDKVMQAKFEQERLNGRYEAVFDTRPDVIFRLEGSPLAPPPWTVGSTRTLTDRQNPWGGLEDHVFYLNSPSQMVWNQRMLYRDNSENGHYKLLTWAEMNNLTPYQVAWFKCQIVRPTVCRINYEEDYFFENHNLERLWHQVPQEEKFKLLVEAGVNGDEYLTYLKMSN